MRLFYGGWYRANSVHQKLPDAMKNFLIALLLGLIIGGAGGFAVGIVVFPYLFPPPEVNEVVTDRSENDIVATDTFIHTNPSDSLHFGRGGVTVYADLVHIAADFRVGPGPKYHVFLVPDAEVSPTTEVEQTMFIDLGRLKLFSGSQNYAIPGGVDPTRYGSVVIWCEQFNVLISPAKLDF